MGSTYSIHQTALATYRLILIKDKGGSHKIDGENYKVIEQGDKRLAPIARIPLLKLATEKIREELHTEIRVSVPLLEGIVEHTG